CRQNHGGTESYPTPILKHSSTPLRHYPSVPSFLRRLLILTFAAHAVHQVDEGQEHGDDDAADDDGQKDDHDGFEQGGHGRDGVIDLIVVVVGNLEKHFGQGAGLLADIDHRDDHGGEDARGLEGRGDGFTLFDALMDGSDGVADDDIAGGFFDDVERLQDGNAAADQSSQGAAEAGDGHLGDDGTDHGHLE